MNLSVDVGVLFDNLWGFVLFKQIVETPDSVIYPEHISTLNTCDQLNFQSIYLQHT